MNHGGKRENAGRKKKEPTLVRRFPAALQAEIDLIVKEYKEAKQKKKERVGKSLKPLPE